VTTDALAPSLAGVRPVAARGPRWAALARREGPILLVGAVFAAAVAVVTPLEQLSQDGWLSMLGGREIVDHGLYARDSLTIFNHGGAWVDQQWLAHLGFYGLASAGGVKLAMLAHFVLVVGAFGAAMAIARRRGAAVLTVAWVGVLTMVPVAWGAIMRTQNLAYPLFVGVLALLMVDRGGPSRRTYLALPLLVVWANVHGSALLGAALVCVYAVVHARKAPLLCAALGAGAVAAVLVTPFGTSIFGYYRSVLGNADFRLIEEWRSPLEDASHWPFLVLLGIAAVVVVARWRRLRAFELLALILLAIASLQAVRNVVWFSYAATAILPIAMTGSAPRPRAPAAMFVPLAFAVAAVVAVSSLAHGEKWYVQQWPAAATVRVASVVEAHPKTTIWATERFADWLVWSRPALAGHIAYDARFELLTHEQFRQIARFGAAYGRDWPALVARFDLVVLESRRNREQIVALRARGRPTLYADRTVTVLGSAAGSSASS
jgi:hypothetical protein